MYKTLMRMSLEDLNLIAEYHHFDVPEVELFGKHKAKQMLVGRFLRVLKPDELKSSRGHWRF